MGSFIPTPRTTLRRLPKRGIFDRAEVFKILDEAFVCHVGFCDEGGRPVVIPTAFGRDGERIYLHGSAASRMLRGLSGGLPVCVTVTLLDALVLARSAFHHSINYRSVVIFGEAVAVEDAARKNLGVRRVSLGSGTSRVALGALQRLVHTLRDDGTFAALGTDAVPYPQVQKLLSRN